MTTSKHWVDRNDDGTTLWAIRKVFEWHNRHYSPFINSLRDQTSMMFSDLFTTRKTNICLNSPRQNDTFQHFDPCVNCPVCARSRMNVCAKNAHDTNIYRRCFQQGFISIRFGVFPEMMCNCVRRHRVSLTSAIQSDKITV